MAWVSENKRILRDASSLFIADQTHATGIIAADIELLIAFSFLFFHASADLAHALRVAAVCVAVTKSKVTHTFFVGMIWPNLGESGTDKASNCDLEFHTK